MNLEKIRAEFRRTVEQETSAFARDNRAAEQRYRAHGLIELITIRLLPLARNWREFETELWKDLGELHESIGDYANGERWLKRARRRYRDAGNFIEESETLVSLGDLCRDACRFQEAIKYYRAGLARAARRRETLRQRADAHWGLAEVFRYLGDYDDAWRHIRNYSRAAKRLNTPDDLSSADWTKAYLHICRGQFTRAQRYFEKFIRDCDKEILDEPFRSTSVTALGDIYRLTGRYEKSLECYRQAQADFERQEHPEGQSWAFAAMAQSLLMLGQTNDALNALRQSEWLARDSNDPLSEAWSLQTRGELNRISGDIAGAYECHSRALQTCRRLRCKLDIAHGYLGLALIREDAKARRSGILRARRIYEELGARPGLRECDSVLGSLHQPAPDIPPLNFV